jgi:hypothetical protein
VVVKTYAAQGGTLGQLSRVRGSVVVQTLARHGRTQEEDCCSKILHDVRGTLGPAEHAVETVVR